MVFKNLLDRAAAYLVKVDILGFEKLIAGNVIIGTNRIQ
jgi:hypothetical protein